MLFRWLRRKKPPAWLQHPGAPAPGALLCRLDQLVDDEPLYLNLGVASNTPPFFCVVLRRGEQVDAYLAMCPHRDRPLATPGAHALYGKGKLACSHHGAVFDMNNGVCTQGPCRGDALPKIEVQVRGNEVVIAEL